MEPNETSPVPLELIRKTEAGCRRRLAAARAAAENDLSRAKQEAETTVRAAAETGRREGAGRREQILADTRREVDAVHLAARKKAEAVRDVDPQQIDRVVQAVLDRVLARGGGEMGP
jgi:vacuolar-type H+-ATPase subunit H